jgi:hypothetical protein
MTLRNICAILGLGGLMLATVFPVASLAQSGDKAPAAAKEATPAAGSATPNTNTNPTKHRYWRHRGGSHPHYGSRRVRT